MSECLCVYMGVCVCVCVCVCACVCVCIYITTEQWACISNHFSIIHDSLWGRRNIVIGQCWDTSGPETVSTNVDHFRFRAASLQIYGGDVINISQDLTKESKLP